MKGGDLTLVPQQGTVGRRKSRKPPRQKHVPIRTCVACRETGAKRGLTRIVRTPDGEVAVDLTGKKNGRGAYLCEKPACWQAAVTSSVVARALKVPLTPQSVERLKNFAVTLQDPTGVEASTATTKEKA